MTTTCPLCASPDSTPLAPSCHDYEYNILYHGAYMHCESCGLARLEPLPSLEDLAKFYPPDYANYNSSPSVLSRLLTSLYDSGVRRQAARFASHGACVLDIGCGGGHYLDKLVGMGLELHGTEFSEEAAHTARRKGHTVHAGILEEMELPAGHFHLIRMNHVIEHVLNPITTLRATARLLHPEGTLVVETPNLNCPDFKLFGKYWGALHFPRHIHLFTPETLKAAAHAAGLRACHTTYTVMPTGWSLGLQNLLVDLMNIKTTNGRCRLYPYFMLGFLPIAMLQKLFAVGTMMQIHFTPCGR